MSIAFKSIKDTYVDSVVQLSAMRAPDGVEAVGVMRATRTPSMVTEFAKDIARFARR